MPKAQATLLKTKTKKHPQQLPLKFLKKPIVHSPQKPDHVDYLQNIKPGRAECV